MTEYERFGLVFTKRRVYKFGHRSGFPHRVKFKNSHAFEELFGEPEVSHGGLPSVFERSMWFVSGFRSKLYCA